MQQTELFGSATPALEGAPRTQAHEGRFPPPSRTIAIPAMPEAGKEGGSDEIPSIGTP